MVNEWTSVLESFYGKPVKVERGKRRGYNTSIGILETPLNGMYIACNSGHVLYVLRICRLFGRGDIKVYSFIDFFGNQRYRGIRNINSIILDHTCYDFMHNNNYNPTLVEKCVDFLLYRDNKNDDTKT